MGLTLTEWLLIAILIVNVACCVIIVVNLSIGNDRLDSMHYSLERIANKTTITSADIELSGGELSKSVSKIRWKMESLTAIEDNSTNLLKKLGELTKQLEKEHLVQLKCYELGLQVESRLARIQEVEEIISRQLTKNT